MKDSCGYALELTKQFLTLSSAGIAFVVGLVFSDSPGKLPFPAVLLCLGLFGMSILCGYLCFMNIVGKVNMEGSYEVFAPFTQRTSMLQIGLFVLGVGVLASRTLSVAWSPPTPAPRPTTVAELAAALTALPAKSASTPLAAPPGASPSPALAPAAPQATPGQASPTPSPTPSP